MNSLVVIYPELLEEWDYEKNAIKPEKVSYGSARKVWWRCKKGHSWKASLNSRTNMKTGCPFCSRQKLPTKNSLVVTHPSFLEEWDYEKNIVSPSEVSFGSTRKVWWRCKEGHSWESALHSRILKKAKCPSCCKKTLENLSVPVKYPELLNEWDYEKNTIKPEEVSYGSHKKVWWKCKHGHSWYARINSRTNMKSGCPFCIGKRVSNKNNLAVKHPELLAEWDYEKNIVGPSEVSYGSNKKVWWKCKQGHSWQATLNSRTARKTGCTSCYVKRKKD